MSKPDTDEFTEYADMIEDGDVAVAGVRVLTVLDSDGEEHTRYKVEGEARALFTTGQLEWAKNDLLHLMFYEEDE